MNDFIKGFLEQLGWIFVVWLIMLSGILIAKPAHAECIAPDIVQPIVDISSRRTLGIICETYSKLEADNELQKQKSEGCFVSFENTDDGKSIYRIFCPYVTATSK